MKLLRIALLIAILPVSIAAWCWLSDRWDKTVYYQPLNLPYPVVDLDVNTGQDSAHKGPYHAGDKLTVRVERTCLLTVTAKSTRRIVRKFSTPDGGTARQPIYTYPGQLGVRIDAGTTVSFPVVSLPSAKDPPTPTIPVPSDIPPGVFVIETSVEFPVHGELQTFTGETVPFTVQ